MPSSVPRLLCSSPSGLSSCMSAETLEYQRRVQGVHPLCDMSKALQHLLVCQGSGGSATCPRSSSTAICPRCSPSPAPAGQPGLGGSAMCPRCLLSLLRVQGFPAPAATCKGSWQLCVVSKGSLHLCDLVQGPWEVVVIVKSLCIVLFIVKASLHLLGCYKSHGAFSVLSRSSINHASSRPLLSLWSSLYPGG